MIPPIVTTAGLAALLKAQGVRGRLGRPISRVTLWHWSLDAESPWSRAVTRRTRHSTWWSTAKLVELGLLSAHQEAAP